MKIFSWMQSKLNGKQVMKKANTNYHMGQATSKEEFSDWPQSLLSIGTFGITTLRSDPEESHPQTPTVPEQLQDELISDHLDEEEAEEEDVVFDNRQAVHLLRSISGRGKDILVDHRKTTLIRNKSLTFLLKKIFTSRNRLHHVRDSLPDPTFDKSRMEKILRAILNKKIHPQTCTAKPMPNKYLVTKDMSMEDDDDKEGSTWVKTDSEYIVLEI